jgi:hypothetical protein
MLLMLRCAMLKKCSESIQDVLQQQQPWPSVSLHKDAQNAMVAESLSPAHHAMRTSLTAHLMPMQKGDQLTTCDVTADA